MFSNAFTHKGIFFGISWWHSKELCGRKKQIQHEIATEIKSAPYLLFKFFLNNQVESKYQLLDSMRVLSLFLSLALFLYLFPFLALFLSFSLPPSLSSSFSLSLSHSLFYRSLYIIPTADCSHTNVLALKQSKCNWQLKFMHAHPLLHFQCENERTNKKKYREKEWIIQRVNQSNINQMSNNCFCQ